MMGGKRTRQVATFVYFRRLSLPSAGFWGMGKALTKMFSRMNHAAPGGPFSTTRCRSLFLLAYLGSRGLHCYDFEGNLK
jgi:hypothetical protein